MGSKCLSIFLTIFVGIALLPTNLGFSKPGAIEVFQVESSVNIRKARSSTSPTVQTLNHGDLFRAGYLRANWYAVFAPETAPTSESQAYGYIYAPLLSKMRQVDQLPPPASSPEPTSVQASAHETKSEESHGWTTLIGAVIGLYILNALTSKKSKRAGKTSKSVKSARAYVKTASPTPNITISMSFGGGTDIVPNSLAWLGANESAKVHRETIRHPLIYSGGKTSSEEASYIDTSLPVASPRFQETCRVA